MLPTQERGILALDEGPGWKEHGVSRGDKWQELMRVERLAAGCAQTFIQALERGSQPFQSSVPAALCCG